LPRSSVRFPCSIDGNDTLLSAFLKKGRTRHCKQNPNSRGFPSASKQESAYLHCLPIRTNDSRETFKRQSLSLFACRDNRIDECLVRGTEDSIQHRTVIRHKRHRSDRAEPQEESTCPLLPGKMAKSLKKWRMKERGNVRFVSIGSRPLMTAETHRSGDTDRFTDCATPEDSEGRDGRNPSGGRPPPLSSPRRRAESGFHERHGA